MNPVRRFPFRSVYNMRDLGGIAVEGGFLRFGRLLRSDAPDGITPEEEAQLWRYGVRTWIDLRGEEERAPVRYARAWRIVPLSLRDPDVSPYDYPARDLYRLIAQRQAPVLAQAVRAIVTALPAGGVLFHCASGKDRTGMLAALLLDWLGAYRGDILADYMVSGVLLRPKYALEQRSVHYPSDTANIEAFLDAVDAFGGAAAYLQNRGVDAAARETLRAAVVDA